MEDIAFSFIIDLLDKAGIVAVTGLLLWDKFKTNGKLTKAVENNTAAIMTLQRRRR